MSALYDVWVLRDGAVHHRGTTDTTVGVLGPTDIGAVARGAVVLLYRGGSKAQQAQLLKAAQERAVRGALPSGPVPSAPPGIAPPSFGRDEASARDERDELVAEDEVDHVDDEPGGLSGVRASGFAAARRGARPLRRMTEEYVPTGLFAPSALGCPNCGETTGHTPRCPRNPDAEIIPEPIYAPRPAQVVYERSIERAADVAAVLCVAPPAANDPAPLASAAPPEIEPATSVPAPAPADSAPSLEREVPATPRPKAGAARASTPGRKPAPRTRREKAAPRTTRRTPTAATTEQRRRALVDEATRVVLRLFDRATALLTKSLLRRRG